MITILGASVVGFLWFTWLHRWMARNSSDATAFLFPKRANDDHVRVARWLWGGLKTWRGWLAARRQAKNSASSAVTIDDWAPSEREIETRRLEEAVATYRALLWDTRDRDPLEWAATQRNLAGTLMRLGERESGILQLEEAVTAGDACLAVIAKVWPPERVQEIHSHREEVMSQLKQRLQN